MNGRLDTDKEIKVLLSNSVGAFDNNRPAMVNDANITIFEDGVNIGDLEIDLNNYIAPYVNDGNWDTWDTIVMNYYKLNYIPKKDKTYRLEVQHPNYNNISASTYILMIFSSITYQLIHQIMENELTFSLALMMI